jgi:lipopolysaccharide/colanic/teichoic acid biosynthesis glycosyltransferase
MYLFFKRIIDILLAGIAFILLSPILIPVMIILVCTGEHKVFYFQKRVGYKNNMFDIWKFATMLKNSPNIGTGEITLRNDPRVLPIGGFLRKTKINELPQIFNVLKGEMSIVGPRPLMEVSFKKYSEEIKSKIYNSKPGMTGIGSIIFRDEESLVSAYQGDPMKYYEENIFPFKGKLEIWYQQNASVLTDFKIIFITAWSIVFPNNNLAQKFFKDLPTREF